MEMPKTAEFSQPRTRSEDVAALSTVSKAEGQIPREEEELFSVLTLGEKEKK